MLMKKNTFITFVLLTVIMSFTIETSAQSVSLSLGVDKKDDKTETKTERVVEKVVEKSGPSLEYELKKLFGMKSETSLGGPRVENLGRFFLDKQTGEVYIVSYYKNELLRWRVQRDSELEDIVIEENAVNYQLIRFGTGNNDIVLVNINSGVMWALDFKGVGFNYKNTKLKHLPMVDTEW